MEGQLVVEAQKGGGEGCFRYLMGRASLLPCVVAVAVPMDLVLAHFSPELGFALPTVDLADIGGLGGGSAIIILLPALDDQLLHPLEILAADDAGVVILHEVFRLLPFVFYFLKWNGVSGAELLRLCELGL